MLAPNGEPWPYGFGWRPSATCEITYKSVMVQDGEMLYNKDNALTGVVSVPFIACSNGKRYLVTYIGDHALENCGKIERFKIMPSHITGMGKCAFKNCTNLTLGNPKYLDVLADIDVLAGPSEVKDSTFYGCSSLKAYDLVNATKIGKAAFRGCTNLSYLEIEESPLGIEVAEDAFYEQTNGGVECTLHIATFQPEGYWKKALEGHFPWCEFNIIQHPIIDVGVEDVTVAPEKKDGAVYNINGQVVRQPGESTNGLPAGIYIKDGKKIVK